MKEFLTAALPWVAMGLAIALFGTHWAQEKKRAESEENADTEKHQDHMTDGMCLGMGLGMILGTTGTVSFAIGISCGALLGALVGISMKK